MGITNRHHERKSEFRARNSYRPFGLNHPAAAQRPFRSVVLFWTAAVLAACLIHFSTSVAVGQSTTEPRDVPVTAKSAGWPVERGNVHGTGVAASVLPAKPELKWKRKIAEALEGTAAVADGVIYIGDTDGTFHALSLQDGSEVWSTEFDTGFISAPGYHAGRVYAGDFNGVLYCLDSKTGEKLWEFDSLSQFYAGPNFLEDAVLLTTEGGVLYSLDAATGEKQWEFTIDAPLRCMPTISEGRIALAGCDARLHVIDAASGEEIDSLEIDQQTGSTPAAADGHVFFGTEGGTFYNLATLPPKEVWSHRDPRRMQPIRSAAAVTEDLVMYGTNGKMLYALDRKTGKPRWQFALRSGMENSPVVSGEHVFFASGRGRLYGVRVKSGEEIWRYNAGGNFLASPAVAEGRLIIGNEDGTLYCFGDP